LASGRLIAPFEFVVPIEEGFHLITRETLYTEKNTVCFREWLMNLIQK
jgi:hypothetical protein